MCFAIYYLNLSFLKWYVRLRRKQKKIYSCICFVWRDSYSVFLLWRNGTMWPYFIGHGGVRVAPLYLGMEIKWHLTLLTNPTRERSSSVSAGSWTPVTKECLKWICIKFSNLSTCPFKRKLTTRLLSNFLLWLQMMWINMKTGTLLYQLKIQNGLK